MRSQFPEYYRVTREDLQKRFGELIFVFDASALLDIFRLEKNITHEIFDVLERYSRQIAIPYHVAEEYNRKIHSVLQEQLRNIDSAQSAFNTFTQALEAKRNQPYISVNSARKLKTLKNSILNDFDVQRRHLLNQLLYGEFQNKMSEVLDGKVMIQLSKEELQQIQEDGERRYEQKIPPGWKDNTKGENAYGDLINWKEILHFAKENQKSIIFISNDQKEDWICKFEGQTVCPHYELLREFYHEVGNKELLFHIYTLDRFLDFIHEHDQDSVSKGTIEQVRDMLNENSIYMINDSMVQMQESISKLAKLWETSNQLGTYTNLLSKLNPLLTISKEKIGAGSQVEDFKDDLTEDVVDNRQFDAAREEIKEDEASAGSTQSPEEEPDEI